MITRVENGLVSLQAASSRCGGNRASSDLLFVLCNVCKHGFIHSFIVLVSGATSEVIAILDKKGFTSLASLKHATEDDTKELSLRRALHVLLREVLKELQHEHGGGPLCSGPVSTGHWHT